MSKSPLGRLRAWGLALAALAGCARYRPYPLDSRTVSAALAVPSHAALARSARDLRQPLLRPIRLDPARPLSPEQVGVVAVLISPALRAQRDRIGVAAGQAIQAGLLPNPQITPNGGVVTGGPGNTNPYGIGVGWDVTSLITLGANHRAAKLSLQSVRLDVAWAEWQAAEAAKSAAYQVVTIQRELQAIGPTDEELRRNLTVIESAYDRHQQTVMQLSAARSSSATITETVLSLRQKLAAAELKLRQAMGLPPNARITLADDVALPCVLNAPSLRGLMSGLEARRLDLAGLRAGYQSQEQTVRAAVLGQYPKINLAVAHATDTTDVRSVTVTATINVPVFDRNQGQIAIQRATRQRLFDEYISRVYTARADIAALLTDITALGRRISAEQTAIANLALLTQTYHRAALVGLADVINYYDSLDKLTTARIALLDLQGSLVNDWVSLELASAVPLPPPQACRPSPAPEGS